MIEHVRNQPPGTTVRVKSRGYGQVKKRVGPRGHVVEFLNGTRTLVFASDLTPIRKQRAVY